MKNPTITQLFFLIALAFATPVNAQGLVDGFFKQKGKASVTASFTRGQYDEFYVGEEKVGPVPAHNKITQQIYGVYAAYGVTDNLTLIGNVPYLSASSNGAPDPVNGTNEQSGIQDVSILAKYRPFSTVTGGGQLDGIAALGVSIPGGYEPNGILSNGSGALATDLHLGLTYRMTSGVFATGTAGYSLRGKADDEFGTVVPDEFDVPNAILLMGKVGYAGPGFYVEGWIDHQSSVDGVDIMGEGFSGNFPETKVNYTRVGVSGFMPLSSTIGVSVGYGSVIDGRNVGATSYVSGGVTVSFGGGK